MCSIMICHMKEHCEGMQPSLIKRILRTGNAKVVDKRFHLYCSEKIITKDLSISNTVEMICHLMNKVG